ncbi:hsp70 nucleotide exchange factor fes1 [Entophlyctis luteolus]|nr:hsp70 nucleotide exchange factor fes1 [Entophlyctis luteolus]
MSAVDEKSKKFVQRPVTSSDLLQWAIINKATAAEDAPSATPTPAAPIDPKWVDVILGKSDSVRMKECVEELQKESNSLEVKLQAFDELEMLAESLDNANDFKILGLWQPIIEILRTNLEPEMRAFAAWVLGTAVQNNPRAQSDVSCSGNWTFGPAQMFQQFIEANGLPALLNSLSADSSPDVRAKCMACLSGLLRQNLKAYELLPTISQQNLSSKSPRLGLGAVLALLDHRESRWRKAQKKSIFFLTGLISGRSGDDPSIVKKAQEDAKEGNWEKSVLELLRVDDLDTELVEMVACVFFSTIDLLVPQCLSFLEQFLPLTELSASDKNLLQSVLKKNPEVDEDLLRKINKLIA